MTTSSNILSVANVAQKVIFSEMEGQISDGMWENTKPLDHYKAWMLSDEQIIVDPKNLGRNFYAIKDNYNLNSQELWFMDEELIVKIKEATGNSKYDVHNLRKDIAELRKIMKIQNPEAGKGAKLSITMEAAIAKKTAEALVKAMPVEEKVENVEEVVIKDIAKVADETTSSSFQYRISSFGKIYWQGEGWYQFSPTNNAWFRTNLIDHTNKSPMAFFSNKDLWE